MRTAVQWKLKDAREILEKWVGARDAYASKKTALKHIKILCMGCFHFSLPSTETEFQWWPLRANSLNCNQSENLTHDWIIFNLCLYINTCLLHYSGFQLFSKGTQISKNLRWCWFHSPETCAMSWLINNYWISKVV